MNLEKLENLLTRIERLLTEQADQIMSFKAACAYTDLSPSAMYKKTSKGEIPHSKPSGKKVYFSKRELDAWLLRNRIKTNDEIETEAIGRVSLRK
jgi:excisionase family DNA binding protein